MNRIPNPSRRQASDVFIGDPFKIHSYNFRYADKPFYPVQNYQRPTPPTPPALAKKSSFQTFYHNPRFSQDPEYIPAKKSPQTSSYRRRLLLESMDMPLGSTVTTPGRQSVPVAPQTRRSPTATDSPLLRTCCQSVRYEAMRRGPSNTTVCQSSTNLRRSAGGGVPPTSTTTFSMDSNAHLQNRRSGCGISIDICSVDSQSEVDNNVSIKIATDAYLLNNTDKVRSKSKPVRCTPRSSGTFGIDKRLSKFSVSETKPRTSVEWELRQREKAREAERQRERERDRQLLEERRLEQERELQEERVRARQRERDREQLRQLERLRDEERLLELEVERERQRLRELERESQRHREYERLCALQEQFRREQMDLLSQEPIPPRPSVPMTSHLYTTTSDDRLPGMAFCDLSSRRTRRLENPTRPKERRKTRPRTTPTIPRDLARSSSGTSNGNVHVTVTTTGRRSNCSMRRSSNDHVSEQKQLNGNQTCVACLNNMPIRITTSRSRDTDLAFSLNHVRMRGSSPAPAERSSSQESQDSCQVNISVYADKLRLMRL
ncbi:GD10971 [Drosophila simulans]|uniref:GD10971 n=1 Tax=Drosophila simulans TaxID=7240 RepID=B4QEE9_DROSI|nr:GD10971 [Drosophila simulans]